MVRVRTFLPIALAVLLVLPMATATIKLQGEFAVRGGWPATPQVHCTFVFDVAGSEQCDVFGSARDVNQLHARIVGKGRVSLAFVDDAKESVQVPLATIKDCTRDCVQMFASGNHMSSPRFRLTVFAEGEAGSTVSVAIERGSGTML